MAREGSFQGIIANRLLFNEGHLQLDMDYGMVIEKNSWN